MLTMKNLNLISVQSWKYLNDAGISFQIVLAPTLGSFFDF